MEFVDVVMKRRAVRRFEEGGVESDVIERIARLAQRTPSAGFSQGQRLIVVTEPDGEAAVAEVRNAQGLVVLHGEFVPDDDDDADETERKAILKPLGIAGTSEGEAEVEFVGSAPTVQEVEFSVRGLPPGTTLSRRTRSAHTSS